MALYTHDTLGEVYYLMYIARSLIDIENVCGYLAIESFPMLSRPVYMNPPVVVLSSACNGWGFRSSCNM